MASEFPKDIGQPPVGGGGMIGRIQRLILKPKDEWSAIDAEPMTVQGILMGWVAPLAAIGPAARLIQSQVFPMSVFGVTWRPPLIGAIVTAVLTWALAIASTYVWALIIDALAPSFGGTKSQISALKAAAFSGTAAWICGIFGILPFLGILAILGLYSIYLFWVGGPMLMKVPQDKAPGFIIVSIIVGAVAMVVASMIALAIGGAMFAMTPNAFGPAGGGTITVGGTTLDTGKLNDAAAKMQAASSSMEASVKGGNGAVKAVDPGALQNLLPGSISGWNRTSVENQGGAAGGIGGSNARAEFQSGDQSFSLSVTDTGVLGNIATLGGALNTSSSKQTTTGYEKSEMQGGNMVEEKWDNQSKSGSYSVLVASRFSVEASGSAPSIDTLKSAVASVNLGQLQSMAK
ncbi:Yip1 family protein [Sphingomonas asaccharolytica]|uniref:Yip1 family protein n=1 Tax=Sphingomonas asaccharolytica TaxID=40681 RepID=UPI000834C4D7|nr:Yip1 family protein [Sphingomonas asaccharolytica]